MHMSARIGKVMNSAKSDVSGQISLSALGFVCGLMGGGLACLFVLTVVGHIESGVELLIPISHSYTGTLTFLLCLYAIWLLAIWWFAKSVRMVFWALATFPLPSLLISFYFAMNP